MSISDENASLTGISEPLHNLGHCGSLLANGDVDTVQLCLLVAALVETPLVDNGVDGDSSFSVGGKLANVKSQKWHQVTLHGYSKSLLVPQEVPSAN